MSAKATSHAWDDPRPTGNEKLLLLCYADYAHDDGTYSCPSAKTLADKTGLDERTIRRVRTRLVDIGCIRIRAELSEYSTPIIDMVYSDGSNQRVIASLYDFGGSQIAPPGKLPPHLVVVSSNDSAIQDLEETTTESDGKLPPPLAICPPHPKTTQTAFKCSPCGKAMASLVNGSTT